MVFGYLLGLSCAEPSEECGLTSTVPDYQPRCEEALLVLWPDETRLRVDGRLEAVLPPDPQENTTYGGTTGNPLTLFLDEELADALETTVTLGPALASARIDAQVGSGRIEGVVDLEQVQGQ